MIGAWKLNEDDVKIIKDLLKQGKTHQSIADLFGVSREHITKINQGHRWNETERSFEMKEQRQGPKRSNDFREFTDTPEISYQKIELLNDNEYLDM